MKGYNREIEELFSFDDVSVMSAKILSSCLLWVR